ncbi:MAG: hypothetical protein K5751_01205 [Treponemataceae bacterium]|nr:hypothetical protein [Treponemataceae bacterium]
MNFELIISEKAKTDIRDTLAYIKNTLANSKAASSLANLITIEISSLRQFPFSGTPVPDQFLADFGFQFLLINNFKAYYIVDKDTKRLLSFVFFMQDAIMNLF